MPTRDIAGPKFFEIDGSCFEQVLSGTARPVVVEFLAAWCPLCHSSSAVMEQLAGEFGGRAYFARLDTDQSPEVAERFGVVSVPTIIIFRQGREADRMVGLRTKEELRDRLELAAAGLRGQSLGTASLAERHD